MEGVADCAERRMAGTAVRHDAGRLVIKNLAEVLLHSEDGIIAEKLVTRHKNHCRERSKPWALIRTCRCAGRMFDRRVAVIISPTGPSPGTGYGLGVTDRNQKW